MKSLAEFFTPKWRSKAYPNWCDFQIIFSSVQGIRIINKNCKLWFVLQKVLPDKCEHGHQLDCELKLQIVFILLYILDSYLWRKVRVSQQRVQVTYMILFFIVTTLCKKERTRDVGQWYSICLACMQQWSLPSATQRERFGMGGIFLLYII